MLGDTEGVGVECRALASAEREDASLGIERLECVMLGGCPLNPRGDGRQDKRKPAVDGVPANSRGPAAMQ